MSSRSATALDSCGCTSTMSDSVNQRIRSMSCTARSMTTPTLDMRGGNGPTRGDRDRENVLARDRLLDGGDRRIEALDMADHQRDAGLLRGGDDLAALLDRGCDRLLDQHMDVLGDAGERDLVMQMGRRRDGDGVDAFGRGAGRASRSSAQLASSVVRARCAGEGSTTPTRLTPGRPLSTRAWLLPITPAPMTPTRKPAVAGCDPLELI